MPKEDSNVASYRLMSGCYDQLAKGRKLYDTQLVLVKKVLRGGREDARVLDAACGTGAVIGALSGDSKYNHLRFMGLDGCPDMLAAGIRNPQLSGVPLICAPWSRLNSFFGTWGPIDVVFFLGNAIAHVDSADELRSIIHSISAGLNDGGIFLFDMRQRWEKQNGQLVQPGRKTNIETAIPPDRLQIGVRDAQIRETCFYRDGRQYICYRTYKYGTDTEIAQAFELSYLPFTERAVLGWLQSERFEAGILDTQDLGYPYKVVMATKVVERENASPHEH